MCFNPILVKGKYVACGSCFECKMQRSIEWSYRCMLEASLHKQNCMITLTYDEANLPDRASLKREDLQKFLKRLREAIAPIKIKYFGCGEYGSKLGRPHYHLLIFGWSPDDLVFFKYDKKKTKLFRSATLERLWKLGFSSVGEVTFDSAKYCAKYMQKPLSNDDKRVKPFTCMSTRGGIGYGAYKLEWLFSDKIYINGKYIKTPRYFLKKIEEVNPEFVEAVREKRLNNSRLMELSDPYQEEPKRRRKRFFEKFRELFCKSKKELEREKYIEQLKKDGVEWAKEWFSHGEYESIFDFYKHFYDKRLDE